MVHSLGFFPSFQECPAQLKKKSHSTIQFFQVHPHPLPWLPWLALRLPPLLLWLQLPGHFEHLIMSSKKNTNPKTRFQQSQSNGSGFCEASCHHGTIFGVILGDVVFNRGAPSVISSYEYTAGGSSLGDAPDKTGLRYVTSSILEVCLGSLGVL